MPWEEKWAAAATMVANRVAWVVESSVVAPRAMAISEAEADEGAAALM